MSGIGQGRPRRSSRRANIAAVVPNINANVNPPAVNNPPGHNPPAQHNPPANVQPAQNNPPAYPGTATNLAALGGMSITDVYYDTMAAQVLLETIGVEPRERARLLSDGFTSVEDMISHYSDDTKGFKLYLETLNKTFGNSTANAVYFTPPIINKMIGVIHYFNVCVNGLHKIPDTLNIGADDAIVFGRHYKESTSTENEDGDDDDITIPTLTGSSTWVSFRDAFSAKLGSTKGRRGFMLLYVIDTTVRSALRANATLFEVANVSLDDDQIFCTQVTYFGPGFKQDNILVWNKLKGLILNSPPYNHIAEFNTTRNGRKAWITLKEFYEGEGFLARNRDRAFSRLNNTFYKGETNRYNFENMSTPTKRHIRYYAMQVTTIIKDLMKPQKYNTLKPILELRQVWKPPSLPSELVDQGSIPLLQFLLFSLLKLSIKA